MLADLKAYEDDFVWVHDHWEELLGKYPDQWIGVQNRRVIANGANFDDVLSQLPDPAHTAVEFINSEDAEVVL